MGLPLKRLFGIGAILLAAFVLASCSDILPRNASPSIKAVQPLKQATLNRLGEIGATPGSAMMIRIFKQSSEFEVWKQTKAGPFKLYKTYNICAWSGTLGPKVAEGDRQAPEGFYNITPAQMNPNSQLLSVLQHWLSEQVRPGLGPHRRQPDGAWRLLVGGLLLDDRPVGRGNLTRWRARASTLVIRSSRCRSSRSA